MLLYKYDIVSEEKLSFHFLVFDFWGPTNYDKRQISRRKEFFIHVCRGVHIKM